MVATDHDRRLEFALLHQIVHRQTELGALAIAQPAYAGRQSLELDPLLGKIDPAAEDPVLRKHLQYQIIRCCDVRGLARQRHPTEWSAAFAEQWTDICRHES